MSKRKLKAAEQNMDLEGSSSEEEESESEGDEDSQTELQNFEQDVKENKKSKTFKNKQRVLIFCARGATTLYRHLMNDLRSLLPHSKREVKFDTSEPLSTINEICEIKSCNNCIFFEVRKKTDCYMWLSKAPHGPSVRFHVSNVQTMAELKYVGNCLKGSRPIIVFDKSFDDEQHPHFKLVKEMLWQAFGTPKGHPNSKPFVDHAICFFIQDNRIWFRNYQISDKEVDKNLKDKHKENELAEIGPRFVMEIIKIFAGSFSGSVIYENANYVAPSILRANIKKQKLGEYAKRVAVREEYKSRMEDITEVQENTINEVDTVFDE